jgi:ATP-dependent helicase/nuclease subunit B
MEGKEDFTLLAGALMKEQRNRGLFDLDPKVIAMLDSGMESSSDIIPLKIKKDGTPDKGSSVCTEADLQLMRRFLHHRLHQMGRDIMGGHIEKAPYVRSRTDDGCIYCPYKGVCGFDEKQHGFTKRQIEAFSDEEVWTKMAEALKEVRE